jgi:hypothetical protein
MKILTSLMIVGAAASVVAAQLPVNGSFKLDLKGWSIAPNKKFAKVINAGKGHETALELAPVKSNFGANSSKMIIGKDVPAGKPFVISFQTKVIEVSDGVFSPSLLLLDEKGKRIKQISMRAGKGKWRNTRNVFGGAYGRKLPKGAHSLVIRFSFWSKKNNVSGKVLIDNVSLEPLTDSSYSIGADWPQSIMANIGNLQTRFEKRSFWTPYRLAWKGTLICKDAFGSHYGTVTNYPGIGFIGTGHRENEDEKLLSLKLLVDGKLVVKPVKQYTCKKSIELIKKSQIKDLILDHITIAEKDRLIEKITIKALKPNKVNYIYVAMHPWLHVMTDYAAFKDGKVAMSGKFDNDGKMKIDKPFRKTAVYSDKLKKGAVTIIKKIPADNKWQVKYWDKQNVYRKFYFQTFKKTVIKPGKDYHFELITIPFDSTPEKWLQTAAKIVAGTSIK